MIEPYNSLCLSSIIEPPSPPPCTSRVFLISMVMLQIFPRMLKCYLPPELHVLLEAGRSLVSCEQLRYKGEICCGHPMIVDHNTCVFSVVSEVDCCYSILLTKPHLCCWTLPIPLISLVIYSWKRFPIVSFFSVYFNVPLTLLLM